MPYSRKPKKRPWVRNRKPFEMANDNSKFYNSTKWRKKSKEYRAKNPLCVHCKENGIVREAQVTDHIIRIVDGGDPFDEDNLQSLCHKCHNSKSSYEGKGIKGNFPKKKQ